MLFRGNKTVGPTIFAIVRDANTLSPNTSRAKLGVSPQPVSLIGAMRFALTMSLCSPDSRLTYRSLNRCALFEWNDRAPNRNVSIPTRTHSVQKFCDGISDI